MSESDSLFDTLRELIVASVPGLVTKDDLAQLEEKLEELEELVEELEERVEERLE